jgi:tetratricopeptide (TPR) repeat protein
MPASIQAENEAQALRRRGLLYFSTALVCFVALSTMLPRGSAQAVSTCEVQSGEIRTLPTGESERIQQSTARNASLASPNRPVDRDACLLPPLDTTASPFVSAPQLQIPSNARKEYQRACVALKDKKGTDAEKHLRNAVADYPKYVAAWVTLGQLLVAQQKHQEGRGACSQATTIDPNYLPAYLCLADVAAHAHDWGEMLSLSNRALEIDPSNNAVAYEYRAAANLNLHNLADAEKSGLRAAEIDKNHREPRVYFVLAQIYEAKRDPTNEAAQLREYLKYANNPDEVAIVKQYLVDLDNQPQK